MSDHTSGLPSGVSIDEAGGAACICGLSLMPGGDFGPIPRANLVTAFVIDHSVHDKHGYPNGLTPTGQPSKAARAALTAARLSADVQRGTQNHHTEDQ